MIFGSGAFEGAFSYASRFEEGTGTNPIMMARRTPAVSRCIANLLFTGRFSPDRCGTRAARCTWAGDEKRALRAST